MKLLIGILLTFSYLQGQIPKPGGGSAAGATGTANPTCTFTAGATSCTITYVSTIADAASASDPACVFTNVTPNVSFEWDSVTKSTTSAVVTFLTAPNAGKCSINLTGGTAPGGGAVGTVTNNSGFLTLDQPLFGNDGADSKVGTKSGNTNKLVTMGAGSPAVNDCAKFDISGNLVSANAACGSGGGGAGTVTNISGNLTVDLPMYGNGTADSKVGTKRGNTNRTQQADSSTPATNDCAKFDVNGNLTTAGIPCGGPGSTVIIGTGLAGDGSALTPVTVDTAAVPTFLLATATLTFPSIAQSACNEQTITLSGAATGDPVFGGAPPDIDQGFVWTEYTSATNTISVRLCKITTGTVTPVAHSWSVMIVRHF